MAARLCSTASALTMIGITQDPVISFPGQSSCNVGRPISLLLDPECEGLENFESLMPLGNLASKSLVVLLIINLWKLKQT